MVRVVNETIKQKMAVVNLRMLIWMSEVKRGDRVRNKYVKENIGMALIMNKMRENRLM